MSRSRFSLVRQAALAIGSNGLALALTLVTGILAARLLGTAGRGQLTAILAITAMVGWAFSIGCGQAAEYHQARQPELGGQLLTSWFPPTLLLGLLAVLVGEMALPTLFAAQTPQALLLARLFLLSAVLVPITELLVGALVGDHDFALFNLIRVGQPMCVAVLYVVLWRTHRFSVASALAGTFAVGILTLSVLAVRVLRRHRPRRPSRSLVRSTLWYGIRAYGTNLAGLMNTRLDLLIIPAFLSASLVGLYAVATSVSWMVVAVSGNLASVVMAAAARQGVEGTRTIVHSLHLTLAFAVALAAAVALLAGLLIPFVYGHAFAGSVLALRVLLPGSVLYAATTMLWSGLNAANRPFTAALSQLAGLAITVVGLLLFLRAGGILAAAVVSTVSYTLIFAASLLLYRRVTAVAWRDLLPSPSLARSYSAYLARRVLATARGRAMAGATSRVHQPWGS